jgi:hypothetical protein
MKRVTPVSLKLHRRDIVIAWRLSVTADGNCGQWIGGKHEQGSGEASKEFHCA